MDIVRVFLGTVGLGSSTFYQRDYEVETADPRVSDLGALPMDVVYMCGRGGSRGEQLLEELALLWSPRAEYIANFEDYVWNLHSESVEHKPRFDVYHSAAPASGLTAKCDREGWPRQLYMLEAWFLKLLPDSHRPRTVIIEIHPPHPPTRDSHFKLRAELNKLGYSTNIVAAPSIGVAVSVDDREASSNAVLSSDPRIYILVGRRYSGAPLQLRKNFGALASSEDWRRTG